MNITSLLIGGSDDGAAAKAAVHAALDAKLATTTAQLRSTLAANAFLDPTKMNDVLTDFFKNVNGGLPSDKA